MMYDKELIEAVESAIEGEYEINLCYYSLENPQDCAKAAITAHLKHLEDNGMVIVPTEPTNAMWRGYIRYMGFDPDEPADTVLMTLVGVGEKGKWCAMINASQEEDNDTL